VTVDASPNAAESRDAEITQLKTQVRELEAKLGRITLRLQKSETQLSHARAQVAWFHRQLFGQKREHVAIAEVERELKNFLEHQEAAATGALPYEVPEPSNSLQILLMLGDPAISTRAPISVEEALAAVGVDPDATPPTPEDPEKKRKGHGRRKLPGDLNVETVRLEPPLAQVEGAKRIDAEVSYRIGIRPAEVIAYAIERTTYETETSTGETRRETAYPPDEMIQRGIFAPSGLAHVVSEKWDRHMPLNRISTYFSQYDVHLPVSTLCGALIRAAQPARGLVDAMEAYAKSVASFVGIDATGALLQKKDRCLRGHTWIRYVEDVAVFVSFTKKHDTETANLLLEGWDCQMLGDGASVYDDFERRGGARGGCFSHGRRNFFYALPTDPRALTGLKLVNDLFTLERAWKEELPAVRLAARQERSAPIFDELLRFCGTVGSGASVGPRSLLSKAGRYVLRQRHRLGRFLQDGAIPIHNNEVELRARHFAVGRGNWTFYGSEAGAEAGSTWLSLVLSARMHKLAVQPYLRDLFRVMPSWPKRRLIELAPHAWKATRARLNAAELAAEFGSLTIPPLIGSSP